MDHVRKNHMHDIRYINNIIHIIAYSVTIVIVWKVKIYVLYINLY